MKIKIGVTDKMKLYNVYRLCEQNVDFFYKNHIIDEGNGINIIGSWKEIQKRFEKLSKIPVFKEDIEIYLKTVPSIEREEEEPKISNKLASKLIELETNIYNKIYTIIELYESMGLSDDNNSNAIDIKLPACEDLDEYISYLKDLNFIFSQCPFLQCDGEVIKFGSVDVGSNWLKLTITAASISVILTNTASLLDKALALRSHYITIQQQEEMLRSMQIKNELAEEQVRTFKQLKDAGMEIVIRRLEKDHEMQLDPEERDKTERSLDKLILFLDKGGEIYASLESPENIQLLFPEIQGDLELPENIIKYLEDKEASQE